ncbi:hypothetical protein BBJ28_00009062 [Nothophytophthora sp. Chile5]|nr:hypothetical protein BBJ28_00009062 [Nothophytophthora sp. Chile5]
MRRSARLLAAKTLLAPSTPPSGASDAGRVAQKRHKTGFSLPSSAADDGLKHVPPPPQTEEEDVEERWTPLCSTRELSCALTLASGQVFSWRKHPHKSETWTGVAGCRVFALRERDFVVQFRCLHPSDRTCDFSSSPLENAGVDLNCLCFVVLAVVVDAEALYERWTRPKDHMTQTISNLRGLRIIRQEPVECLFSFICSSNNNIARIQGMVDNLKATYGDLLYEEDVGEEKPPHRFYAFPSVDTLVSKCEEATLRALGFGYRAPFIVKTAKQLQTLGGASYLHGIRDGVAVESKVKKPKVKQAEAEAEEKENQVHVTSYHTYQEQLMVFTGVGRKVADCVALFSLEKLEAIPVDTHVWQIACRELDATLSDRKSVTPSVYRVVGDLFRTRFAPQAGWAHSVLFAGDLTPFRPQLSRGVRKPKAKAKAKRASKAEAGEAARSTVLRVCVLSPVSNVVMLILSVVTLVPVGACLAAAWLDAHDSDEKQALL